MTFSEWAQPGIYGASSGAFAVSILDFTWGGWKTSSSAQTMAEDMAADEVALAMVPVRLGMSVADPKIAEKIAFFQDRSGMDRSNAMMETGWATRPRSDTPDRESASSCLAGLELDGS